MGLDATVRKINDNDPSDKWYEEEQDEYWGTIVNNLKTVLKKEFDYDHVEKDGGTVSLRIGSYFTIHILRRKAAQLSGFKESKEFYERRPTFLYFEHLINHEDNEGFYFPVDFGDKGVLWEVLHPSHGNTRTSIGSSVNLKRELMSLLPHLERDTNALCNHVSPIRIWGRLYRLAVDSLRSGLPIVFH